MDPEKIEELCREGKNKVFVAFSGPSVKIEEYTICIFDLLSCEEEVDPLTFRIVCGPVAEGEYSVAMSPFCAVGNTLYMFDWSVDVNNGKKSIYSIDISDPAFSKKTLYKDDLKKAGEMLYPKARHTAVLAPCGKKILVFSIAHKPFGRFELFDTVEGSSQALPDLRATMPTRVLAYGFINDTTFVAVIDDSEGGEMYVLDLDALPQGWMNRKEIGDGVVKVKTIPYTYRAYTTCFEIFQGRFCFSSSGGFADLMFLDKGDNIWPYGQFFGNNLYSEFFTHLHHNDEYGISRFCGLMVDRRETSLFVRLDVSLADFERYKQDLERGCPETPVCLCPEREQSESIYKQHVKTFTCSLKQLDQLGHFVGFFSF